MGLQWLFVCTCVSVCVSVHLHTWVSAYTSTRMFLLFLTLYPYARFDVHVYFDHTGNGERAAERQRSDCSPRISAAGTEVEQAEGIGEEGLEN